MLEGKKEVKLSLFSDNRIVFVELMHNYSKVEGYEVNI